MFRCFLRKDRAGTIAGLILGAVGVGITDILEETIQKLKDKLLEDAE